jgi:hypothetical protein
MAKTSLLTTAGNQPTGPVKHTDFDLENAVAFYLGEENSVALQNLGYTESEAQAIIDEGYWRYLITSNDESHTEAYYVLNALADTFAVYATGALPIEISFDGYLYTSKNEDDRIDFIDFYLSKLRGTLLKRSNLVIVMIVKDTIYRIRTQRMNVGTSSTFQDWTRMSLSGIGFKYKVHDLYNLKVT